jgi:putative peptide zinc metalloprotease protein
LIDNFGALHFGFIKAPFCILKAIYNHMNNVTFRNSFNSPDTMSSVSMRRFKSDVHWVPLPSYWILRNPEDVTHMQIDDDTIKLLIDDIDDINQPLLAIAKKYGISIQEVDCLMSQLANFAMLDGTKLPPPPPKGKWNPLHLLYMRYPLINPDDWLTKYVNYLEWIWTSTTGFFLIALLTLASVLATDSHDKVIETGKNLFENQGHELIIPFVFLTIIVVSLHELAHAFTLKHYDGIVKEMGVFFMLLIPACYTDTTDSCWLKKHQQVLVVGAGIICQVVMAAIGFLVWYITEQSSGISTIGYLLMVTGLVTLAINLNPLSSGFDGYYLASTITGINNLRTRSRLFYIRLLKGKPVYEESNFVRWSLAIYAPLSLVYVLSVFSFLIWSIGSWTGINLPAIAFTLTILWAIYYFAPTPNFKFMNNFMNKNGSADSQVATPDQKSVASPSPQSTEKPNSPSTKNSKKLLPYLLLILLASSMFLRAPYEVGGETKLDTLPDPDHRRSIVNPQQVPCKIDSVSVTVGQLVKEGDELVKLSCRLLDEDIQKTQLELEKANQDLETLNKQSAIAISSARTEYAKSQAASAAAAQSKSVDESGLLNQINILEKQKESFQSDKDTAEIKLSRYEKLEKDIVPQITLDDLRGTSKRLSKNIEGVDEQIANVKTQFRNNAQTDQRRADIQTITADESSEIADINSRSTSIRDTIKNRNARLEALTSQQKSLVLRSPIAGKVYPSGTTSEFDNLKDREILSSSPIMLIANTKQLVAKIEIDRKDRELAEKGADVKFRSHSSRDKSYEGKISRNDPKYNTSTVPNQPSTTIEVSFIVENPEENLLVGETGWAKIYTEDMFLFQRIGWEISRMIPTRFRG